MERKNRNIIFCQGDKNELEEITEMKYEFLKFDDIVSEDVKEIYEGEVLPTFICAYAPKSNGGPITHEGLMDLLRYKAVKRGADAVVHFYSTIAENSISEGYARGTPVRKARK